MTLEGLIKHVDDEYGCCLSMVSAGTSMLFTEFMDKKKVNQRKLMTLKEIVELVGKKQLPESQKFVILELLATDEETDEDVDLPSLRCRIR